MSKVRPIPDGCEHPIPHLIVRDGDAAIRFYERAFGAEEDYRVPMPDGRLLHAELRVGGSKLFLAEDMPDMCGGQAREPRALKGSPVNIHRYVDDVDAAMRRAAEAGATVTMPATDMFWGDRYGQVEDPFGHVWSFATHVRDVEPQDIGRAAAEMFAQAPAKPGAQAADRPATSLDLIRVQFQACAYVVKTNVGDVTHPESLRSFGQVNALYWILAHLVTTRNQLLRALGAEPVWSDEEGRRFDRHAPPLGDSQVRPLSELWTAYDLSQQRLLDAIGRLQPEDLARTAPAEAQDKLIRTTGDLLAVLAFHDAYHSGQTGVIRRLLGRPPADL